MGIRQEICAARAWAMRLIKGYSAVSSLSHGVPAQVRTGTSPGRREMYDGKYLERSKNTREEKTVEACDIKYETEMKIQCR